MTGPSRPSVVVNPLGKALHHYVREVESVLVDCGQDVRIQEVDEPSAGSGGRLAWLARCYFSVLRARIKKPIRIILAWPAAGFVDVLVMRLIAGRRGTVVFHDPRPLVRAVGYGRLVRWAARRCPSVTLLVHSRAAANEMHAMGFSNTVAVPHPIGTVEKRSASDGGGGPVVVVGQYKPERDVALLTALSGELGGVYELRIHGRGWPQIPGWTVDSRFLPEDELDTVIASAGVVLIPYRRFYQSGVAVRAVEVGTPVVGPRGSSMDDLAVAEPSLLATPGDPADWARAIRFAVGMPRSRVGILGATYRNDAVSSWLRALECGTSHDG